MTVFYLDGETGSDSNDGSEENPFATLDFATTQLASGDILLVKDGTYIGQWAFWEIAPGLSWSSPTIVQAAPGHSPKIVAVADQQAVLFVGTHHVVLRGFEIDGTGGIESCVKISWATGVYTAHHIRIQECDIHSFTRQGISGGGAAAGDADGCEFLFNRVHDGGTIAHFDHGFYFTAANTLFDGNEVFNCAAFAFHIYNENEERAFNNILRRNFAHDNARLGSGAGCILADGGGHLCHSNLFARNDGGIRVQYATAGSSIFNNTLDDNNVAGAKPGIAIDGVPDCAVKNNIIWRHATPVEVLNTTADVSDNLTTDPHFSVDPPVVASDFRVRVSSAAIDTGATLAEVAIDFDGTPRPFGAAYDIGAYEIPAVELAFLGVIGALKPLGALLPAGGFRFLEAVTLAVELITEQTLAQPLGVRLKTKAIAFAAETATPLALGATAKIAAAGLAAETALAQPVAGISTRTADLAAETTAALATVRAKAVTVGLTEETDTAFGTVGSLAVVLGIAAEDAVAVAVTAAKVAGALGLTTVTEIAPDLARAKLRAIGPTIGVDTAELVGRLHTRTGELATTTETAQPTTVNQARTAGQAPSLEEALGVFAVVGIEIGLTQELATVLPLAPVAKLRTAGLALDLGEALPVTVIGQIIGVAGLALQAEIAFDLGRQKLQDIAPAADSVETAFAIELPAKLRTAGLAESLETVFPISANVGTAAGLAETIETAFPAGRHKLGIMHRKDEISEALALAATAKIATAAFAATLETGLQISANKTKLAGQAASTAAALLAVANKAHLAPLVTSLEQAIGVFVTQGDEVGPTSSAETAPAVGKRKERQVELVEELALAPAATGRKAGAIAFAFSVEQALAVSLQIAGQAGLAADLATALELSRVKVRASDEGQEASQAFVVTSRIGSQVGMAGEIVEALQIDGRTKAKTIGLATEQASALFALQFAGAMRYIALRGRMVERVTLHGRHGL